MVTIYLLWDTEGEPDQFFAEHQVCRYATLHNKKLIQITEQLLYIRGQVSTQFRGALFTLHKYCMTLLVTFLQDYSAGGQGSPELGHIFRLDNQSTRFSSPAPLTEVR